MLTDDHLAMRQRIENRCRPQLVRSVECLSMRGTHKNKNIWLTVVRGFAVVVGVIGGKQSGRGRRSQERKEGVTRDMGFLFRVRLASFFVGAASASVAGFCLLDKDYMLAHDAIAQQVKGIYENFDECYEGPSQACHSFGKSEGNGNLKTCRGIRLDRDVCCF
ncbi:unnamed protein product [Musa banksii]